MFTFENLSACTKTKPEELEEVSSKKIMTPDDELFTSSSEGSEPKDPPPPAPVDPGLDIEIRISPLEDEETIRLPLLEELPGETSPPPDELLELDDVNIMPDELDEEDEPGGSVLVDESLATQVSKWGLQSKPPIMLLQQSGKSYG